MYKPSEKLLFFRTNKNADKSVVRHENRSPPGKLLPSGEKKELTFPGQSKLFEYILYKLTIHAESSSASGCLC